MFESFESRYQRVSVILMVLAAVSAVAAVLVGVDDNPPGIALAVLAGTTFVTSLVHHWRSPRRFLVLSTISFGLSVILVGVLILIDISLAGGHVPESIASAVDFVGNALALMTAFLVVPSILVGLVGALVTWLAGRRK